MYGQFLTDLQDKIVTKLIENMSEKLSNLQDVAHATTQTDEVNNWLKQ
jgi:hypothetical protein